MESSETKSKRKPRRKALRRALLILLGILLGVSIYSANARNILGNQLPMPFGYGLANVLSGSMEPTFSKGALLLVRDTKDVKEGDIVVYQSQGELIVHRIIREKGEIIVTQGDANNVADTPFRKDQIKGKVIGWVPYLGSVSQIFRKPLVIILMILLAILLMERSFRAEKDADHEEIEAIKAEIRRLREEQSTGGAHKDLAGNGRTDSNSTDSNNNNNENQSNRTAD